MWQASHSARPLSRSYWSSGCASLGLIWCAVVAATGKRIFLPLAGFRYDYDYYEVGKMGYYWATMPRDEKMVQTLDGFGGLTFLMQPGVIEYGFAIAHNGFSVRPVLDRQP